MKVDNLKKTFEEIDIPRSELTKDVTRKAGVLLREFAPRISLVGRELWMERNSRVWQGPQIRALECKWDAQNETPTDDANTKTRRICLQYLFLYGKQYGAVSFLSMIAAPFLLLVWVRILDNMIFDFNNLIIVSALVSILLLEKGLRSYYLEYTRRKKEQASTPLVRVEAVYIWLGIVALVPTYDIFIASILYLGTFLSGILIWIAELSGRVPWTHNMDYVPVFIWIEAEVNPQEDETIYLEDFERWKIIGACWDEYHYQTQFRDADYLREFMKIKETDPIKRIRLKIDNRWHSLASTEKWAESSRKSSALFLSNAVVFLLSCMMITIFYFSPEFYLANYPQTGYWFILFVALLVLVGIQRFHYPLVTDERWEIITSLTIKKHHLDDRKLLFLWNLDDKKAQLEIRTKVQSPFRLDPKFFTDFRDDIWQIVYSLVREVEHLKSKKTAGGGN